MALAQAYENANCLEQELAWFRNHLDAVLQSCLPGGEENGQAVQDDPFAVLAASAPDLTPFAGTTPYADFVLHYEMTPEERLVLLLALVPHIRPQLLDHLFLKNAELDRGFTQFGGLRGASHNGFLPTGETVMFLLAGQDLRRRFALQHMLDGRHYFAQHGILKLEAVQHNEPYLAGMLAISRTHLDMLTRGDVSAPSFGPDFPAQKLSSRESWSDLVLETHVLAQIEEIRSWIIHQETLMQEWEFARRMKPGYRALFYGPPGTGKSMTASLLGQETGLDVYRIDLSMVISKYIGETEKNLARIFDYAGQHQWILFFDEADALFGKRTATKDAHDRYANQEVAYLLQRIEEYEGVAILASNLKDHIDDAFTRRFHTIIHFPLPREADRLKLWQNAFTDKVTLEEPELLKELARAHEISGGAVMNVAHYAALMSARRGEPVILRRDIEAGIRKELQKEGRSL